MQVVAHCALNCHWGIEEDSNWALLLVYLELEHHILRYSTNKLGMILVVILFSWSLDFIVRISSGVWTGLACLSAVSLVSWHLTDNSTSMKLLVNNRSGSNFFKLSEPCMCGRDRQTSTYGNSRCLSLVLFVSIIFSCRWLVLDALFILDLEGSSLCTKDLSLLVITVLLFNSILLFLTMMD